MVNSELTQVHVQVKRKQGHESRTDSSGNLELLLTEATLDKELGGRANQALNGRRVPPTEACPVQ